KFPPDAPRDWPAGWRSPGPGSPPRRPRPPGRRAPGPGRRRFGSAVGARSKVRAWGEILFLPEGRAAGARSPRRPFQPPVIGGAPPDVALRGPARSRPRRRVGRRDRRLRPRRLQQAAGLGVVGVVGELLPQLVVRPGRLAPLAQLLVRLARLQ